MYNPFNNLEIQIYGASHTDKIGVKINGIPIGEKVDLKYVQDFVDRRKSGQNVWSTPRKEEDKVIILSGIENGQVVGEIEGVIYNKNVRKNDYENTQFVPRPSHADYVSYVKDNLSSIPSGGGRFSGRLTAPLCIAGGIAKQLLEKRGIKVLSYIRSIGEVEGENYTNSTINEEKIENISTNLKALSNASEMEEEVLKALNSGDSVGGVVDVLVYNMPIGIGDNLFNGLEGRISSAVFGVPAVKGIEFGLGFLMSKKLGSQVNDQYYFNGEKITTLTNNNGGINGGISNGETICLSVSLKPTPSISKPQKSVNLKTMENVTLSVKGRHDSCIVPRAMVCVEGAVALAILDAILDN